MVFFIKIHLKIFFEHIQVHLTSTKNENEYLHCVLKAAKYEKQKPVSCTSLL